MLDSAAVLLTVSITSSLWMPWHLHSHCLCLHFIPFCCLLLLSVVQQIVFNLDPKSQTIINSKGLQAISEKLVARQQQWAHREIIVCHLCTRLVRERLNNEHSVPAKAPSSSLCLSPFSQRTWKALMVLTPAESTGSIQEIFWLERVENHKLTSCACQESKQAQGYLSISSQTVLTLSTMPAKYSQDGGQLSRIWPHLHAIYNNTNVQNRGLSHESSLSAVALITSLWTKTGYTGTEFLARCQKPC